VPLNALASKTYGEHQATVNYAALFAAGADRTIKLDGVTYQIALTGSGLTIKKIDSPEEDQQQLPFPDLQMSHDPDDKGR
jgi:hypothetical protein